MTETATRSSLDLAAQATREAEAGRATCKFCKRTGPFSKFIVVMCGGGVVMAECLGCANSGNEILIRSGPMGIEVLRARGGGVVAATDRALNAFTKRPSP